MNPGYHTVQDLVQNRLERHACIVHVDIGRADVGDRLVFWLLVRNRGIKILSLTYTP